MMAPWVNGTSQLKKDDKIDSLYATLNTTMDEGKRKQIFADFQKHMYDNAVAMKAGNYGLFQVATREAEELQAIPHSTHVGRLAGAEVRKPGGQGPLASAGLRKEEP